MDQLLMSADTTLIRLTVTFSTSRADVVVFALFAMDVSQSSPVWAMIGNAILLEDAIWGYSGLVGDNALVFGVASSPGQSVAATRAFLLQGDVLVEQTNFTVPESVSSTSQLLSTSFFHTMNSKVVAYTYRADSSGMPTITTSPFNFFVGHGQLLVQLAPQIRCTTSQIVTFCSSYRQFHALHF